MSTSSDGRVAIVTGGSGGIGRAVCSRLADDGLRVVVHYAGNDDRANELVDEIVGSGGEAIAVAGDIGDEADVAALFDEAERAFGGIDVVVNTAGIMPLAPLANFSLDDFDRTIRTNLRGTFLVSRQFVKRVRSGGAIINFSSSVIKLALENYGAYAASKGGVEAMTLIMAKELRGRNVTSNTVAPGPVDTPLFREGKPQDVIDRMSQMPLVEQRLGQPADIAEVVSFLAGPARWIDGQTIYINGGVAA
jgi:3-oxoacyl-[acyl-carrier protein] reductase